MKKLLHRIAEFKGLEVVEIHNIEGGNREPTAIFREVLVRGFFPIILYIMEVKPYPEMLPSSPGKRALIYSFTEGLNNNEYTYRVFREAYKEQDKFLHGAKDPGLLDLAICAHAESCPTPPDDWALKLVSNVEAACHRLNWESAECLAS